MKSPRWRWLRVVLAVLGGTALTGLLVWLATRGRDRRPGRTLLLALFAALAGVGLTVRLVRWAAGPGSRAGPRRVLLFAALTGVALTALLARLLIGPAIEALPQAQVFLRAYAGVLAASLAVTAGFALMGALSAGALPLTRLGVPVRAGPSRTGVSLAVSGGLLLIPALLILAGTAVYREGAFGPDLHLGVLLGAVAALYGGLAGSVLGLLTLRLGQSWRPALAGLAGAGLGGAVCGLILPLLGTPDVIRSGWGFLGLVVLLVALIHLAWGLSVRAALLRLLTLGRRPGRRKVPVQAASRVQVNVVATLALLLLASGAGLVRTLGEFVTTRPVNAAPPRVVRTPGAPACPEPRDALERAVWRVTTRGGRPDLSCRHSVYALLRMPGPTPGNLPGREKEVHPGPAASGFDDVADLVLTARREVLFTTMQWEEGPLNPGDTLAHALARLYARVRADPAAYPDGLSVRLSLGNYPVVSTFEWGAEVWGALRDLTVAGVPLSDPSLGWRVQLGNYAGTFPHSHVKLLVIDGELLMAAGFNYAYGHDPPGHPSGRGRGLFDLALVARGPVAQDGVNVFEDLWTRSKVVECPGTPDPARPHDGCRLGAAGTPAARPAPRAAVSGGGTARVFSLYRREGFTEADEAVTALLDAAREDVTLLHVNFSMNAGCIIALLNPTLCTERDRLPWMTALLGALERGVTVRLMTSPAELSGIENRIALAYLGREMRRRGIPTSRFEARWFPTPLHAKATLIDGRMLLVGSMNLHYSSWTQGPLGLAEYDLATADPARIREFRRLYDGFWARADPVTLPPFLTETRAGERD